MCSVHEPVTLTWLRDDDNIKLMITEIRRLYSCLKMWKAIPLGPKKVT